MKIGFIDYYLDEWHANNYPSLIAEASNGAHEISCAYAHIEPPAEMNLPSGKESVPPVDSGTLWKSTSRSRCLQVEENLRL